MRGVIARALKKKQGFAIVSVKEERGPGLSHCRSGGSMSAVSRERARQQSGERRGCGAGGQGFAARDRTAAVEAEIAGLAALSLKDLRVSWQRLYRVAPPTGTAYRRRRPRLRGSWRAAHSPHHSFWHA